MPALNILISAIIADLEALLNTAEEDAMIEEMESRHWDNWLCTHDW